MGGRTKEAKTADANLRRHKKLCVICSHAQKAEIELDYVHCIPFADISRRYNVSKQSIENHTLMTELYKKRDRKHFYWRVIERANYEKVNMDNALEAAKQLDRLEHKLVDNPTPSNISVQYLFPAMTQEPKVLDGTGHADDKNRLRAPSDSAQIPPKPEEV